MSRAVLARRFTELVGDPPMTFLTEWRLSLALLDLLREPVPRFLPRSPSRSATGSPMR